MKGRKNMLLYDQVIKNKENPETKLTNKPENRKARDFTNGATMIHGM